MLKLQPVRVFMKKGGIYLSVLLFIIPVILSVTSIQTINERGKTWYRGDYDPAYAYLFNSLNITNGLAPGHYDHPGTNMQELGAVVLKVTWMIDHHGGKDLTEAVIKQPEHYLRILNVCVALLGSIVILLLGIVLFRFTGNIWYSLLFQATPFISGLILYNGFTRLSQESMLMASSLALAAFTVAWFFKEDHYSQKKWSLVFGMICGFGLVSKIIFLPLMLIPLLLLAKNRYRIRFIIVTGITFLTLTIPIIIRYPSMAWWFVNLLIHSGIYGTGEISVVDIPHYPSALKLLLTGNPLYSAIFLLSGISLLVLLIRNRFNKSALLKREILVLAGIFIVQAAGFIITAKHPKMAYLLPYECLSAVTLIVVIHLLFLWIRNQTINYLVKAVIILPLLYFGFTYSTVQKNKLYYTDPEVLNEQAWNLALTKGNAVLGINPGPSPIAAAFFANVYAADKYQDELQGYYPDQYIFDTYKNSIVNWKREPVSFNNLMEKYGYNVTVIGYDVDFLKPLLSFHKNISMEKQVFGKTEVAILTPRK